ncbi:uncharacterized protein LOC132301352 [Cornus florida]|uniref:uncharacterized protein LOC132301352 n=1 Tax=Cornus florida TaxID=4283 RepID=UPI00289E6A20|nr:uncharacterized protein LOC132301352 [Cornus florida]
MKTEWGFEKFVSLEEFQNPSNGYLIDDTCVFRAEVFVTKYEGKGECRSMKKLLWDKIFTWKIYNFSEITKRRLCSEEFDIGGWNWKLFLYPKGNGEVKGVSLSLFLEVAESEKRYLKSKLPGHVNICVESDAEVKRLLRDVKPSHNLFKIESFSTLLETKIEKYETDDFEAGGYKWKLCIYPNGNKKRNGEGYISLYLVIVDTENLPCGWEINVNFKLFVFDNIQHKCLTIEGKGESLSITNLRSDNVYTWEIDNFSACKESLFSREFNIGGRKWKLLLCPNGHGTAKSQSLSLFLELADSGNLFLKP